MRAEPRDLARQIVVIAAVVFMIIAAMVGVGLFGGTNVRELQGGALDADSTVLSPGRQAFSIWSLIYVLMIAYAVWQALPGQRARERQRAAGWWIAVTAVLNGCWLLAAQFLNLPATVVVIVLLVAALSVTIRILVVHPSGRWTDIVFADATVGLHLGWVSLATVANVTAWLAAEVVPAQSEAASDAWGIAVLVVVALLGVAIAWGTRGRLAPGLAMAWGLVWIGVARTTDEPDSTPVAVTAWIAAAIVVVVPLVMRITGIHSTGFRSSARTPAESEQVR
ncbi:tryptophan-rich sensory protein [Microbacterium invictum]|uniref:Tryptophan-rich sensory protein n=1 Tax=Microbacterium invictum TaxID=515415 RepID=A0AA40SPW9_9MICO|nr:MULTISPECIES: tryptophan-rich sensory protein [Microbacterium]MBB4140213.1 hypothetical protein [Microbacterium invictum]